MKQLWRLLCIFVGSFSILLFNGCGFLGKDDGVLRDGYYKTIVMEPGGTLIGKGRISEGDAEKGGLVYKVEMGKEHEKDKVKMITAQYGGQPLDVLWKTTLRVPMSSRFSTLVADYEDGYVRYTFQNSKGQSTGGYYFASAIRFKMDEKNRTSIAYLYDHNGEPGIGGKDNMAQILFEYDREGQLTQLKFADQNGSLVTTQSFLGGNASTLHIEYDEKEKGQIASISWRNQNGGYVKGALWAKSDYTYDDKGRLIKVTHKGADGRLINIRNISSSPLSHPQDLRNFFRSLDELRSGTVEGGAVTRYTYEDTSFDPVKISFFGEAGQPYAADDQHVSEYRLVYDKQGNIVQISTYGTDGQRIPFVKESIDTLQMKYDASGNLGELAFWQKDNPVAIAIYGDQKSHVAKIQYAYDAQCRVIEEKYFDMAGESTSKMRYGVPYYRLTNEYDGDGNIEKVSYFDQNGSQMDIDSLSLLYGKWKAGDENNGFTIDFQKERVTMEIISGGQHSVYPDMPFTVVRNLIDKVNGLGTVTLRIREPGMIEEVSYELVSDSVLKTAANFREIQLVRVR